MTRIAVALLLSLLAAPSPAEEIRAYFDRAMYRTGRAKLDALLAAEPDSAEGRALLAELRLVHEDFAGAEAAARRAVELDLKNPRYWMLWARARFLQGREEARQGRPKDAVKQRFADAEVGFRRVREIDPEHPDALWWIGWCREWQGFTGTAEQFYESQIEQFPEVPGGYRRLGELRAIRADRADDAAAAAKLRKEAIAVYDRGLERAGDDAGLHYLRALALEAAGDEEGAADALRRVVLADPEHERAWSRLRKRVEDDADLIPLAKDALEKHPSAAYPAWLVGYHTLHRDPWRREKPWTHFEKTLEVVLPALEVHGDHEELYRIAFRAAAELIGKTPKTAPNGPAALAAFERIHKAYAWSGDAANNLGFFLREQRKYDESLAWYLKAVERAPENQDILNDTGLIYLFHFPEDRAKGLPYFLKTVALVREGDQKPERGYWDALENLCKHYWEVDRRPEKVVEYARLRYLTTKGVAPYNMSRVAEGYAKKARKTLGK